MIEKMKKKGHVTILIYVLLIALCITMLPIISSGDEADPKDVTDKVTISKINITYNEDSTWKTYMTGGAVLDTERDKKFEQGTGMTFYVTWSVSSKNIQGINEGDYFLVTMPDKYFKFSDMGPVKITDSNGQLIGEYTVTNQQMKVVFSSIVNSSKTTEIKNGWLTTKGTLNASEIPNNTITIGGITIPITATEPSEPDDGNEEPIGPLDPSMKGPSDPIIKSGLIDNGQHKSSWYITANLDKYRAQYNGSSDDAKENLIIEDKLQSSQKFNDIQFYHRYYYAFKTDEGDLKMSAQYFDVYYDASQVFTKLEPLKDENYTTFKSRVTTSGKNGEKPAYGIWQDKYVVVSLGETPGKLLMPLTYGELKAKLATNKYNGYLIPKTVQDNTLSAYASNFYGSTDDNTKASVYSLNLKIEATVSGSDREINNEVSMNWNTELYATAGAMVRFESIDGGAELGLPGSVTIRKYDGETEGTLDGVKLKLQKINSQNIYEDYDPQDGDMVRTTSGGSVVFYELGYGSYKVVEKETLPGYSKRLAFNEGDGTFSIDGNEQGTIYIDALNYKEGVQGQSDNPGSDVDTQKVLGEDEEPEVLGENAKTSDISNITPLLIIMLIVLVLLLIVSLQHSLRRN